VKRYLFHIENGDLLLPLEGLEITRCVVDHAFSLEAAHADGMVTVRIEGPLSLKDGRSEHAIDPSVPTELGPALGLVRGSIERARVSPEGRLSLVFQDGREVTVEPSDDFEAWELTAPRGVKAVCRAGGGVSTWGAAP
jgi:hypothetical protein